MLRIEIPSLDRGTILEFTPNFKANNGEGDYGAYILDSEGNRYVGFLRDFRGKIEEGESVKSIIEGLDKEKGIIYLQEVVSLGNRMIVYAKERFRKDYLLGRFRVNNVLINNPLGKYKLGEHILGEVLHANEKEFLYFMNPLRKSKRAEFLKCKGIILPKDYN